MWIVAAVVVCVVPLGLYCTRLATAWRHEVFPGFFVAANRAVPSVGRYGWTGLRAGLPFHAQVVSVDGRPVTSHAALYAYVRSLPPEVEVRYGVEKHGGVREYVVPTMRFGDADFWTTVGLFAVNGWLYLLAAIVVFVLQPARSAARVFLLMGTTLALFTFGALALYRPAGAALVGLHFVAQALFPATFVHLAAYFPVERRWAGRRTRIVGAAYLASLLLAVASILGFYADPPDLRPLYVAWVYAAAAIVVLCGSALSAAWERRSARVRSQARIVALGLLAATLPACIGFIDNAQGGGSMPINFIAITPVLFFIAVGYAIVRHDLFDIDRLVRHAVAYSMLTVVIMLAYVATLVGAERLAGPELRGSPVLTILFVIAVACAFDPLRRRLQRLIDRMFFRHRADYRATMRDVAEALTTMLDLRAIVTSLGDALLEALAVERVTIAFWFAGGETGIWCSDPGVPIGTVATPQLRLCLERDRAVVAREALEGSTVPEDVAVAGEIDALRAVIVLPLVLSGGTIGYVALGGKRSARPYDREDLELVATMAHQAAIAIYNASTYLLLALLNRSLEEKVRSRTQELERSNDALALAYDRLQSAQAQLVQAEKMASLGQLVAGVAHELNNPLTFIVGNIAPVREHLATLRADARDRGDPQGLAVCEEMEQILAVIGSGAERTAAIVKDLRTFSRVDDGAVTVADLREGLRVSLSLLRPRWKDRIAIHLDVDELPPVACDPSQINQVFMNILSNACDAVEHTGNIWVRGWCEGGLVALAFRDDGAGISSDDLSRIFDPFFTTKEVGKGTGLGLAISHAIVEKHGGRIVAGAAPGRGAEFTVYLPVREKRRSVA